MKNTCQEYIYIGSLITLLLAGGISVCFGAETNPIVTEVAQRELSSQEERIREKPLEPLLQEPKVEVELEKEKEEPLADEGPRFFLKKIRLKGNTLFSEKDFQVYLQEYENREISFKQLRDLTLLITNHYRSNGYATSRAFIPPQRINLKDVTIQIIEGKVGKVLVEGERWFKGRVYRSILSMKENEIFRIQDLESGLRNINSQSDRFAKAYLIAGEKPLTSDIILKAKDKFPVHAGYEFNNQGTKLTHKERHELFLNHNNFLGFGDALAASLTLAEQSAITGSSFNYRLPIYSSKTTLLLNASAVRTQLARQLREFHVRGHSWSLTPGIQQTILEKKRFTLSSYFGLEIKDSMTSLDEHKISFDRMRVFRAGPRMEIRDRWGRTSLSADVHWGLGGFLGGSQTNDPNLTREGAGGNFVYYTGAASRMQRLPLNTFLITRANAQYSPAALTSLEQFRAGGVSSVRGYPEGDSSGDSGITVSNEIRVPSLFIPKNWNFPRTKKSVRDALSLLGFVDMGYALFDSRSRQEADKDRLLLGAGFGFRFHFDRYTSVSFDMGFPFGNDSTDEDKPQIHLSTRVEY